MSSSCQAPPNHGRRSTRSAVALTLGIVATTVASAYGVDAATAPRPTAQSNHAAAPEIVAWDVATTVWTTPPPILDIESPVSTASPVPTTLPSASASAPSPRRVIALPPTAPRSRLISADGRLDTAVGVYSDCTGAAPLPRYQAAIDTCITNRTYFVGHSPGAFSPLLDENVGTIIQWWDGAGALHRLRIVARRDWTRGSGAPAPPVSSDVVAQFQTCLDSTGSQELILDATPA